MAENIEQYLKLADKYDIPSLKNDVRVFPLLSARWIAYLFSDRDIGFRYWIQWI
jgi:hypothetical protein